MTSIPNFFGGAIVFGYWVIGLFFLKFWRRTRDPFFRAFAMAFVLLGAGRLVEAIMRTNETQTPTVYLFRLLAFLIIIFAILRKNMAAKK
jgi:hypothetical protein